MSPVETSMPDGATTGRDLEECGTRNELEKTRWRRRIEARRAQAELLQAATGSQAFKTQIHLALRDLDEGAMWLNVNGSSDSGPGLRSVSRPALTMVDGLLNIAACRLDFVRNLVGTMESDSEPAEELVDTWR